MKNKIFKIIVLLTLALFITISCVIVASADEVSTFSFFKNCNCLDSGYTFVYLSLDDGTHIVESYCESCGEYASGETVVCSFENGGACVCGNVCAHSFSGGECTVCNYVCPHAETYNAYSSSNNGKHVWMKKCTLCEKQIDQAVYDCLFENVVCECGYACPHEDTFIYYVSGNNGTHIEETHCNICQTEISATDYINCTFSSNNTCACGYVDNSASGSEETMSCGHPVSYGTTTCVSRGDGTHYDETVCDVCQIIILTGNDRPCTYQGGTSACDSCGASCPHKNTINTDYRSTGVAPGHHTYTVECSDCQTDIFTAVPAVECIYESETSLVCSLCGAVKPDDESAEMADCGHLLSQLEASIVADGNGTHHTQYYCMVDQMVGHNGETVACTFSEGETECNVCGAACPHLNITLSTLTSNNNGTHRYVSNCDSCGMSFSGVEDCRFDIQSLTCECGYACPHKTTGSFYAPFGSGTHIETKTCTDCRAEISVSDPLPCILIDGICSLCEAEVSGGSGSSGCDHGESYMTVFWTGNGDGTHRWEKVCDVCQIVTSSGTFEACQYTLGACSICQRSHNCTSFECMVTSSDYLAAAVSCKSPASYFYSCEICGKCGTEKFTSGTALPHEFANGACTVCGQCEHVAFNDTVTYIGNNMHRVDRICNKCKEIILTLESECSFEDNICIYCNGIKDGMVESTSADEFESATEIESVIEGESGKDSSISDDDLNFNFLPVIFVAALGVGVFAFIPKGEKRR